MKTLFILSFFFFFQNIKSQDLFITYDNNCIIKKSISKNNTTTFESYRIDFLDESPQYKFYLDENGQLMKNIQISGKSNGSLDFVYHNYKNQNKAIKIAFNEMKNIIKCDEIIYSKMTNFHELFSKFKNIYFVDITKKRKNYKAKKIRILENTIL